MKPELWGVRFLKFETLLHFLKLLFEHKIRLVGILVYRWVKASRYYSRQIKCGGTDAKKT